MVCSMRLNEIQTRFHNTLLNREATEPRALAGLLREGGIPLQNRLQVYRDNVIAGLTKVLAESFPVTDVLVGRGFFEGMARAFILAHPPAQGCLTWYGAGFDVFVEYYEPAKTLAYLPDVARMEIAMNEAYYAPDDKPLTPEHLARTSPDNLSETVLQLRASVRLIRSDFPLNTIRVFCEAGQSEGTLDIVSGGENLLIWRPFLKTEVTVVDQADWDMMTSLQGGAALGPAVGRTLEKHPGFDFQGFLGRYLALEALAALDTRCGSD